MKWISVEEEIDQLELAKKFMEKFFHERGNYEERYYDRNGKRLSVVEFNDYLQDLEYKVLKQCWYGPFFVSTVWLGVDHRFRLDLDDESKPLIFETMIFDKREKERKKAEPLIGHEVNEYQERYSTEEEAYAGHKEACKIAEKAARKLPNSDEEAPSL